LSFKELTPGSLTESNWKQMEHRKSLRTSGSLYLFFPQHNLCSLPRPQHASSGDRKYSR